MNIVISGYYGFDNAGDELILESLLSALKSQHPRAEITVLSASPRETSKRFDVRSRSRWSPLAVMGAIVHCDVLISGGGGLFQDTTGGLSLYYYLAIIALAALLRKKIIICAVGINPLKMFDAWLAARTLNFASVIGVRDEGSRDLLTKWGGDRKKIILVADAVFLAKLPPINSRTIEKPKVAFVLRPSHDAASVARIADGLVQKMSATVIFIPFQPAIDKSYHERVRALMSSSSTLYEWAHMDELLVTLLSADLIISQRFHALVIAARVGIPLVGVSRDPKIVRLMKEIGCYCASDFSDNGVSEEALAGQLDRPEEFREKMSRVIPVFESRAEKILDLFADGSRE